MKDKQKSNKYKEEIDKTPTDALELKIIDAIKKEDPKIRKESIVRIQEKIRTIKMESHFQGPIPPPEILKGYNDLIPDAAERILTMAEKQASHRQFIEKKIVSTGTRNETTGLFMAYTIVMVTIIGGIFLIFYDKGLLGLSSIIAAIVGAASIFIIGKSKEEKVEKESKKKK